MQEFKTIFFAKNISEILYQIKNVPGMEIVGGCTAKKELSEKTLSVRSIEELRGISRHERYIDFGPAVTLNEILDLGRHRVPEILYESALSVGNFFVRNMATLGGNICSTEKNVRHTLYAPLLALGATMKFKNTENQMTTTIPFGKFAGVPEGQLLVNVRVPTEDWDVSLFRRTGPEHLIEENSASFCFLAKTDKSVLSNIKIVMAGVFVFEDQELENRLLGIRLPISEKAIQKFLEEAESSFDRMAGEKKYNPILKRQFLNLTQHSLNQLT